VKSLFLAWFFIYRRRQLSVLCQNPEINHLVGIPSFMQTYTLEQLACFSSHFMVVFYSPGAGDPGHSRIVGSNSLITILVLKDQYLLRTQSCFRVQPLLHHSQRGGNANQADWLKRAMTHWPRLPPLQKLRSPSRQRPTRSLRSRRTHPISASAESPWARLPVPRPPSPPARLPMKRRASTLY
jgi:hypothetical protein